MMFFSTTEASPACSCLPWLRSLPAVAVHIGRMGTDCHSASRRRLGEQNLSWRLASKHDCAPLRSRRRPPACLRTMSESGAGALSSSPSACAPPRWSERSRRARRGATAGLASASSSARARVAEVVAREVERLERARAPRRAARRGARRARPPARRWPRARRGRGRGATTRPRRRAARARRRARPRRSAAPRARCSRPRRDRRRRRRGGRRRDARGGGAPQSDTSQSLAVASPRGGGGGGGGRRLGAAAAYTRRPACRCSCARASAPSGTSRRSTPRSCSACTAWRLCCRSSGSRTRRAPHPRGRRRRPRSRRRRPRSRAR